MSTTIRHHLAALTIGVMLSVPAFASADYGNGSGGDPVDADYTAAVKATEAKDWDKAIELLNKAAARDDKNADVHNLLGYAERKRGNVEVAFKHYERALALDPKHRGAHEYVGEAYLMIGNVAKAEEHLARLDKLCTFGCGEYKKLKTAIATYKQQH
jgi:tetratricopeptide (TPR) repeat protein